MLYVLFSFYPYGFLFSSFPWYNMQVPSGHSPGFAEAVYFRCQIQWQKKNPQTHCNNVLWSHGADSRIRTGDLILTKDALYRLSYISMLSFDNVRILSQRI